MKTFNRMTEKHMSNAHGGDIIFVPIILAITGLIAGVGAATYESQNNNK